MFMGLGGLRMARSRAWHGSSENAATTSAMAAFNSPPAVGSAMRGYFDALISGIIADGDWGSLDWLVALAPGSSTDEHDGRVNLRNPAKILATVNTPTFTTGFGFSFNGTDQYLHINEAPNAAGNVYAQNSAHVGIWCNQQNGSSGSRIQVGVVSGSAVQILPSTSTSGSIRINDASGLALPTPSPASRTGGRIISRTGASARAAYLNGTSVASDTTASSTVPNNIAMPRVAASYGVDRFWFYSSGSGLDAAAASRIHTRVNTFGLAVGAI